MTVALAMEQKKKEKKSTDHRLVLSLMFGSLNQVHLLLRYGLRDQRSFRKYPDFHQVLGRVSLFSAFAGSLEVGYGQCESPTTF